MGAPDIISDIGDLIPIRGNEMYYDIQLSISQILDIGLKPIFLGGDHSITYPVIKSLSKYYPQLCILQFDAHPDLYDQYDGNKLSHASPFARIMTCPCYIY